MTPTRTSALGRRHVQLSGLVVDLESDLVKLGTVSTCMVAAEHEIASTWEDDSYVGLGAAAVTAIEGIKNWRDWSRCDIGTCHAYLQQLVARFRSGL
jgi:hypothetical protein